MIISSDIDTSLLQISQNNKTSEPWSIIDISEIEVSDLLHSITGTLEGKPPHFIFSERDSFLLTELNLGRKIILKGHFSKELIDALAPVLLERQKDPKAKGQLILVSEETPLFGFMPEESCRTHHVSIAEKQLALPLAKQIELAPFLAKESLAKLQARAAYEGTGSSEESWTGLKSLPLNLQAPVDFSPDPQIRTAETNAFFQQRRDAIDRALKNQPYVFLAGLSGVGKSTYVEKEFCSEDELMFLGESQIESWANCDTPGTKYLFIDEANIGDRQWTEFEGLFNIPPTLFIDGRFYPLTEKHKVIFAGNPANYSDERQLPSLFARHGNTVVFSPLTQNVVFERILKPVFAKKSLEKQAQNSEIRDADIESISSYILKAYQFLCSCSTTDVLISPRELQMIALLVRSHLSNDPNANPMALTQAFTYEIIAPLVPKEYEQQFIKDFTPQIPFIFSDRSDTSDFKLTQSRLPIKHLIDERLALSELRHLETLENAAQLYGGLGGIILEGEPGIGKSELVMEVLRSRGYKECLQNTDISEPRVFYRMPVSMSVGEKQKLLVEAFNRGAVVVIDSSSLCRKRTSVSRTNL